MSKNRLLCAGIISVLLSQMPVGAFAGTPSETRTHAVADCLTEANRPVTRKSQYQNGSPRLREALNNAYSPNVSAAKKTCRALAR